MKFTVIYFVGKSQRTKIINAKDLDEALEIVKSKSKFRNWVDIIMCDKTKGEINY